MLEGEAVYLGTVFAIDGLMHLNILNDTSIVPGTEHQGLREDSLGLWSSFKYPKCLSTASLSHLVSTRREGFPNQTNIINMIIAR